MRIITQYSIQDYKRNSSNEYFLHVGIQFERNVRRGFGQRQSRLVSHK